MGEHLDKIDFVIKKGIELIFQYGHQLLGSMIAVLVALYSTKFLQQLAGQRMH